MNHTEIVLTQALLVAVHRQTDLERRVNNLEQICSKMAETIHQMAYAHLAHVRGALIDVEA